PPVSNPGLDLPPTLGDAALDPGAAGTAASVPTAPRRVRTNGPVERRSPASPLPGSVSRDLEPQPPAPGLPPKLPPPGILPAHRSQSPPPALLPPAPSAAPPSPLLPARSSDGRIAIHNQTPSPLD